MLLIHLNCQVSKKIGKARIEKTKTELLSVIENTDLANMKEIIEQMANESEASMTDLAAALLYMKQLKQPLQPKEDPKPRP